MSRIVLFNKPYGVMSQFSPHPTRRTLADYIAVKAVYPAGRLDADSEGLLILTDDGKLQQRLSDPRRKTEKTYWAQVEGVPQPASLAAFAAGIRYRDIEYLPARAQIIDQPAQLWPRDPPIRERKSVPTAWLEIHLREGKNRQVRHMTAAIGHPTLRLIRAAVGPWQLGELAPGHYRTVETDAGAVK